jgi:flagellar motor protein MotB
MEHEKVNVKENVHSSQPFRFKPGPAANTYTPLSPVVQHYRNLGNQAVQRMLETRTLQAKLKIGQPNDRYEREADRVADQVMRMPEPGIQRQSTCPECMEEEEEEEIAQAKLVHNKAPPETTGFHGQLRSLKGGGQPLPGSTRSFFESRLGCDFSDVRLHNNRGAADSARTLNAQAYTVGTDIVFAQGQYQPGTPPGRRLLAHELVHTIQQRKSRQQGGELNLQRQEEGSGEPPGLPEVPNMLTIDLLDPLNSSLRISGFSLPSPRDIMNGLSYLRGLGRPQIDVPGINWPSTGLSQEQLRLAACRAAPILCQTPQPPQPGGGRLRLRFPGTLTLPRVRMPRLVYVAYENIDHFVYNRADIPDRHRGLLDRSATDMIDHPNYFTSLVGHTDTHGGRRHNQRLSERRARAVRNYLVGRAVPREQITSVRGVGETQPRFSDDQTNWLSAARNRRVEMNIKRVSWEISFIPRLTIPAPRLTIPGPMPAAALVEDQRVAVLPAERAMFNNLRSFMSNVTQRIRAFIERRPEGTGLMTSDNENIISLLDLLTQLNDDLEDENLFIRFDHAGGGVGGRYTELDDMIHLRPFTNDEERARTASNLIHEYTHRIRDATLENLLRAGMH